MHEITIQFCKSQNVNVIFKINWKEQTIPLTIPQRLYKDGQQASGKIFIITDYQRNSNWNDSEVLPHINESGPTKNANKQ